MEIEELLRKLPETKKKEWSYLETIGVSHRETIMANLLAFYFDPSEKHGLGDVFIKALLQTKTQDLDANKKCEIPSRVAEIAAKGFNWAKVIVEDSTDDRKRIDILIETEELVIAIEFKINHNLDNPLSSYVSRVKGQYPGKVEYYIVLTPSWKEPMGDAKGNKDFKQMMLSHFIEKVEHLVQAQGKFKKLDEPYQFESLDEAQQSMLYTDFIYTIENRKIRITMMDKYSEKVKSDETLLKEIESAFEEFNDLKKYIEVKVDGLLKLLEKNPGNKFSIMGGSKDKIESVLYCTKGDKQIKIRLTLKGWSVELWGKKDDKREQKRIKELGNHKTHLDVILKEIEDWSDIFDETSWS